MNRIIPKTRDSQKQQGFALVVAISLMAFILLLILGLTATLRVETVVSNQAMEMAKAEENAKTALMIALGELQEAAGPDQRITANSEILGDRVAQDHVLGVWLPMPLQQNGSGDVRNSSLTEPLNTDQLRDEYVSSWDNGNKARDNRFLKWLVSGDPTDQTDINLPNSNIAASATHTTLVGANTLGTSNAAVASDDLLRAPIVRTEDGAYAWAVISENMKARVNLDHNQSDNIQDRLVERAAAPVTGIQALNDPSSSNRVDVGSQYVSSNGTVVSDLDKAISIEELPLAAQTTTPALRTELKKYYHDISVSSKGLLTNAKWGGWKKDLNTLASMDRAARAANYTFERTDPGSPAWLPTFPPADQFIFSSAEYVDSQNNNTVGHIGPAWDTLIQYMNEYKSVGNDGSNDWVGKVPVYKQAETVDDLFESYDWRWKLPVFRKSLWLLSLYQAPAPSNASQQNLYLLAKPICEIWNPYNVPLKMPDGFSMQVSQSNFPIQIRVNDEDPKDIGNYSGGKYIMDFTGIEIPPGESIYFSNTNPNPVAGDLSIEIGGLANLGGFYKPSNALVENYVAGQSVQLSFQLGRNQSANDIEVGILNGQNGFQREAFLTENRSFLTDTNIEVFGDFSSPISPTISSSAPQPFLLIGNVMKDELSHEQYDGISSLEISDVERSTVPPWLYLPLTSNKYTLRNNAGYAHTFDLSSYVFVARRVTGNQLPIQFEPSAIGSNIDLGYFGRASGLNAVFNRSKLGSPQVVAREFPIQPLTSMMQLQHARLGDYGTHPSYKLDAIHWNKGGEVYTSFPYVNFAFGNSFNSPFFNESEIDRIDLSDIVGGKPNESKATQLHDKSWKLNSLLWDNWFMSGVGDWEAQIDNSSTTQTADEVLEAVASASGGGRPLPNKRFVTNVPNQSTAEDDLVSGSSVRADAHEKLAQYLYNIGQFNVNSTSKLAWKTLLAGADLTARDFQYLKGGLPTNASWERDTNSEGKYVFSRFTVPIGEATATSEVATDRDKRWLGVRALTDQELDTLAEKIVDQVKSRGPFLSLGEFMNRGIGPRSARTVKGAIQSAIDNAGLNDDVRNDSRAVALNTLIAPQHGSSVFVNEEAFGHYDEDGNPITGSMIKGAPGYLTQADLLTSVAPSLTVRCDTFTIRTYGETTDLSGNTSAKVWCEAVVQRTPEYVNPDKDDTDFRVLEDDGTINTLNGDDNQKYGRKFEIVSIRFLTEDEI